MGSSPAVQAAQQASSTLQLAPDTYIYSLSRLSHAHDNSIACIASPASLVYFDSSNLSVTNHISKCHDSVTALAAAGDRFATAGRDGLVKLWDGRGKARDATTVFQGWSTDMAVELYAYLV